MTEDLMPVFRAERPDLADIPDEALRGTFNYQAWETGYLFQRAMREAADAVAAFARAWLDIGRPRR